MQVPMYYVYKYGRALASHKIASLVRARAWAVENAGPNWAICDQHGNVVASA